MGTAVITKFFTEYKTYHEKIKQFLLSQNFKSVMAQKIAHLLLNRLLFLHFLQGKKWDIKMMNIFKRSELDKAKFHLSDALLLDINENFFGQFQFTISEHVDNNQENIIDPSILGSISESVIIGTERGSAGVFYTPKPEVDFMCRIALYEYLVRINPAHTHLLFDFVFIPKSQWINNTTLPTGKLIEHLNMLKIMDPACGSGAFLIGMFQIITELYEKLHKQISLETKQNIIRSLLYGLDINDWAIHMAKYRLWLALLATENSHPLKLHTNLGFSFNLHVGDSLIQPIDEKFDIIITNPPYVNRNLILPPRIDAKKKGLSIKSLDNQRKDYKNKLGEMILSHFDERISKMCDLYVYFFFKGLEMLKPSGVMVIISSNSWMNVRFGGDLQKGILKYGQLRYVIENHVQKSFSEAEINTAIIVLHKQKNMSNLTGWTQFIAFKKRFEEMKQIHYREIFTTHKDPNLTYLEDDISFQETDVWQTLSIQNKTLGKFGGTVVQSIDTSSNQELFTLADYKYAKWSVFLLAPKIFYAILNQKKKIFSKLDKYCEIHLGSTSGYNPFFYVTKDIIEKFEIEPEFLVPLIKSPHDIGKPFENFTKLTKFAFPVSKKKDEIQDTGALNYIHYGESLVPPIYERPFFKTSNRSKDNWYHLMYKSGTILLPNLIDV
ncbi:MAG: N-6 DNA methylase, partial [Candidatus Heimdallarchaeota archaeon]|nr:N-6 DNA methylase [Candidatus Heimdallarchaeota archaeon]